MLVFYNRIVAGEEIAAPTISSRLGNPTKEVAAAVEAAMVRTKGHGEAVRGHHRADGVRQILVQAAGVLVRTGLNKQGISSSSSSSSPHGDRLVSIIYLVVLKVQWKY